MFKTYWETFQFPFKSEIQVQSAGSQLQYKIQFQAHR